MRAQLSDEVAFRIRELIMRGELRESEFVRLDRMAEQLGVSRTPVREALMALREQGFVELIPNRGFTVARPTKADLRDLFEVETFISGELAARSAERIDRDTVETLEGIFAGLTDAAIAADWTRYERLDSQFHKAINAAAHSPKLAWFLGMTHRYIPFNPFNFYSKRDVFRSNKEHSEIVAALHERDPIAARAVMEGHVERASEVILRHYGKSDGVARNAARA